MTKEEYLGKLEGLVDTIVLALFYLCVAKRVASIAAEKKKVNPLSGAIFPIVYICIAAFYGTVLCVILTLFHLTSFTFSDIFLCITAVIFHSQIGAEK